MEGPQMPIRVLLVDDNALFREGVARILAGDGRFAVVGQASRGADAIGPAEELDPDLILMDLRMPGLSGADTIRRIRQRDGAVPIGVLTILDSDQNVQAAMAAGANGYVAKDTTPAELCQAAFDLAHGRPVEIAPTPRASPARGQARPTGGLSRLTARELEVLRALATGASNQAIARRLGISPKTLRNHISNTYHKLGIYDRAQAVIAAVREGLVDARAL
jgi:DNA-binding NarL/FixJ family response regulator